MMVVFKNHDHIWLLLVFVQDWQSKSPLRRAWEAQSWLWACRSPLYDRYSGPAEDRYRSPDYGRYPRWGTLLFLYLHYEYYLCYPWYLVLLCNQTHPLFIDIFVFCVTAGHLFEGQGHERVGIGGGVIIGVEGVTLKCAWVFCSCYNMLISFC